MLTQLDTQSWAKELKTGNAQFVRTAAGVLYVVSNVRADGTFIILRSNPVPPDPGPGFTFLTVATASVGTSTIDFDPVVFYDENTQLLQIVGTVDDSASANPTLTNLVKYVYDTTTSSGFPITLASPVQLVTATNIQAAYDIVGLNSGHKLITAAISDPALVITSPTSPVYQPLFQATITNIAIANSTLTVTANNVFNVGQLIGFTGLSTATFLNSKVVQATAVSGTTFTALFFYQSVDEAHTIPSSPFTVTVTNSAIWESNVRVTFAANRLILTQVASNPGPSQYSVTGGTYTFNPADVNKNILITYNQFYTSASDTGLGTPVFSGQSLVAFELDGSDACVANSLKVLANSPERTGNVVSAVSVLTPNGTDVEVYYESHPKLISFGDQLFNFLQINRTSGTWGSPTSLTTIGGRFTNGGLSVSLDANGNRYFSQIFYTQINHPEGLLGNALLGTRPNAGTWLFHETPGTVVGGSIIQGDLELSSLTESRVIPASTPFTIQVLQPFLGDLGVTHTIGGAPFTKVSSGPTTGQYTVSATGLYGFAAADTAVGVQIAYYSELNYIYLLQPFASQPPPGNLPASYSFHAGLVNTATMGFSDTPGFYNQQTFTWLRGTKSVIDDLSLWAGVGEREILTSVAEPQLIPSAAPYSLEVAHAANFWQNTSVVDNSGSTALTYTAVLAPAGRGQYVVTPNGEYTFNAADASVGIIGVDLTSNILTITGTNVSNFTPGMTLKFSGLSSSTYLNGQSVVITGVNPNLRTITTNFTHANNPEHSDTGLLGKPLIITYTYLSSIVPVYISNFNVPPIATITPTSVTVFRAQPQTFDASSSSDADQDPLEFFWSENDGDLTNITLTPNGNMATLNVSRAIGGNQQAHITNVALTSNVVTITAVNTFSNGQIVRFNDLVNATFLNGQTVTIASASGAQFTAAFTHANYTSTLDYGDAGVDRDFNVGVAVVDLMSDMTTQRHPAAAVTNVAVTSNVITVTANTDLAVGEQVMLYGIVHAPPAAPTLNFTSGGTLAAATYFVVTTYLNAVGESTVSAESTISVPSNNVLTVASPAASGGATKWNVYISTTTGAETLQQSPAINLGTNFTLPTSGLITGTTPPTVNTALLQFINDKAYTIVSWNSTSFTATTTGGLANLASTAVNGNAIPQFQFAISNVTVPFNAQPTIAFPNPPWTPTSLVGFMNPVPLVNVARNTAITITHGTITSPTTQFPVIITGASDTDDNTSYQWIQIQGTNVLPGQVQQGQTQIIVATEDLIFTTKGVDLSGETLVFQLTVNDGVNSAVAAVCAVRVAAYDFVTTDTKRLNRSVWTESDAITRVSMTTNNLTITCNNTFTVGQRVTLQGLTTATFLNGLTLKITSVIGSGPVFTGFTAITHLIVSTYASAPDTGTATVVARIAQRNTAQTWGPLDNSIFFTDLTNIKRTSIVDGTDRYVTVSPSSVTVFGVFDGIPPTLAVLRRLFTPNSTAIVDVSHTEQDYTLVLDNTGKIYRYSVAPLINTDNPDTIIDTTTLSNMTFDRILTSTSFGDIRVIVLSGPEGCLLLQVASDTLNAQSTLTLSEASNLLVGANNVQFIRLSNVENLSTGKLLLGTVVLATADVTAVAITSDILTATSLNNFLVGDLVQLSGFTTTGTTFLNGLTVPVLTTNGTTFTAPLTYSGTLAPTGVNAGAMGTALNDGQTFETLVDLQFQQVIGSFNSSNLRNQFVNTGEILFEPNSAYSGRPTAPVLNTPTTTLGGPNGPVINISWVQQRPDLVTSYNLQYATQPTTLFILPGSLTFAAPNFGQNVMVMDVTSDILLTQVALGDSIGSNQYTVDASGNYVFNTSQLSHEISLVFRSPFTPLQNISSGAIEKISFSLTSGSYAFEIQALSNDGAGPFSNIQVFSF